VVEPTPAHESARMRPGNRSPITVNGDGQCVRSATQDFEDVVVRNAYPPTRDRRIWTQLTAPDLTGRTR